MIAQRGWPGTGRRWIRTKTIDELYVIDPDTFCWLWRGVVTERDRGKLVPRFKADGAARVLYERHVGHVDKLLGQACGNQICVNPNHQIVSGINNPKRITLLVSKEIDRRFLSGCICDASCADQQPGTGECVYFLAKTQGPVTMKECTCVPPGAKTYHGKDGCLRCKGTGIDRISPQEIKE